MFCAIATTIDRCKSESVVDVFQVVKAQRIQKPGLVLTVVSIIVSPSTSLHAVTITFHYNYATCNIYYVYIYTYINFHYISCTVLSHYVGAVPVCV